MMQGKGCCGKMMGQGMQGHGMMGKGCCGMMGQGMMAQGCPMMDKDVEKKVENTADGVTIKISSKNPETVKKIQEHVAKMGECCAKMRGAWRRRKLPKAREKITPAGLS